MAGYPIDFGRILMGGFGSGRRRSANSKSTTQDLLPLDVRVVTQRKNASDGNLFVTKVRNGAPFLSAEAELHFDHVAIRTYAYKDGKPIALDQESVILSATSCNFGGSRRWFICPAYKCGRRVAILFVGTYIACRRCHDLAYRSTRETACDRQLRRLGIIRRRLAWRDGLLHGPGIKPKWMRWPTYMRLLDQHDRIAKPLLARLKFHLRSQD